MDFTNVQTALVVLPENCSESELKQSAPYQALVTASPAAAVTEATSSNLPSNGNYLIANLMLLINF